MTCPWLLSDGSDPLRPDAGDLAEAQRRVVRHLDTGRLSFVTDLGFSGSEERVLGEGNYSGHYGWPRRFAVAP